MYPAMGAPITIDRPGIVRTSPINRSTLGTSAKIAHMAGRAGAMVAAAITVRVLTASRVSFVSGKLGFA